MAGAPEQQIESHEWPSMIVKIAVLFILISDCWEANWNITEHQLAPCVLQDNRADGSVWRGMWFWHEAHTA